MVVNAEEIKVKELDKLELLAELRGFEDAEHLLDEFVLEVICPGICINEECEYIIYVGSDTDNSLCEICQTETVVSAFVLADIVEENGGNL